MKRRINSGFGFLVTAVAALVVLNAPLRVTAEATVAVMAAYDSYAGEVEARLAQEHRSPGTFLVTADLERVRRGELIVDELTAQGGQDVGGALLHDWRGTAFVAGAKVADFDRIMRNYQAYPQIYAPQVVSAHVTIQAGDHYQVEMRVRQQHVLTVVMDTAYDVKFGKLDGKHGYSVSRSTGIEEIDQPDTKHERALGPGEEHGFLWRLNTYWSYEERDGGLYLQIESISLSRSIPTGLGWAIGPFIESVPRESLEFTLRSTCQALQKH